MREIFRRGEDVHTATATGETATFCGQPWVVPASMIFVPCKDGISHNEIEDAKPEWIEAGGNVLFQAMLAKANELPVTGKSRETVAVA